MRCRTRRPLWGARCAVGLIAASILSCGDALGPLSHALSPEEFLVQAVGTRAVRVTWKPIDNPDVVSYQLERRKNHEGGFTPLPATIPRPQSTALVVYIDTDVQPDTYYGYRVVTITRFGDKSPPSVVGGTRTPPPPGIVVVTESQAPVPEAMDPDGYRATVAGPDTMTEPIGLAAERRFTPLRTGSYKVMLHGVISRCEVADDSVRTVPVVDTGVNTVARVTFDVSCRDPNRGRIVAIVTATGDSLPADPYRLLALGIPDASTPSGAEIVAPPPATVQAAGGSARFDNLIPGTYEVELNSLQHCTTTDQVERTVAVRPGSIDTLRFALTCESQRPDDSNRPLVWRNSWSASSAAPGQRVTLTIALDATARSAMQIGSVQGELRYDSDILRLESAEPVTTNGLEGLTANTLTPGLVTLLAADDGTGVAGIAGIARIEFTVIGAAGAKAATRSKVTEVGTGDFENVTDLTRVMEDTLEIGAAGGGGATKQPPTAVIANGPYNGTAGTALTFSAAGSNDPDGGNVTYAWTFGDGTTGTGASPSKTYAAAGVYDVRLTVTDDENATATAQTTATIEIGGGSTDPRPLVWRNAWSSTSASLNQRVTLTMVLDAGALPQLKVASIEGVVLYDKTLLRYESFSAADNSIPGTIVNKPTDGEISISAVDGSGIGRSGQIGITRVEFTVLAASGSAVTTTTVEKVTTADLEDYEQQTRPQEATLQIGSGGGGGTTKQPPIAVIGGTPPFTATAGTPLTFSGTGSNDPDGGEIASHQWDFGDGSATASGATATKSYAAPGEYTLRLTVTDDEGITGTAQAAVTISAAAPQVGSLTGTVTSPQRGALANVQLSVSGAATAATTNGSGTYSFAGLSIGQKTVSIVTGSLPSGCTAPASQTATITAGGSTIVNFTVTCPPANQAPVAVIAGSPPFTGTVGTALTFSATGSNDPDGGNITAYAWEFGDNGANGSGSSVNKTYTVAGVYTLRLTVTDDEGSTASTQTTVTITAGGSGSAKPLIWKYNFTSVQPNGTVFLEVFYDLNADLPETPTPESLRSWKLDSLKWSSALLQFVKVSPGNVGTIAEQASSAGKLSASGTLPAGPLSEKLVYVAIIEFKSLAPGSTTTQTWLGPLLGPGSFSYNSKTAIEETTFTRQQ